MHDPKKPSASRPRRVPLWLPYLQSITEKPKGTFTFDYNGGSETVQLDTVQSIMIYGDSNTSLERRTGLPSKGNGGKIRPQPIPTR